MIVPFLLCHIEYHGDDRKERIGLPGVILRDIEGQKIHTGSQVFRIAEVLGPAVRLRPLEATVCHEPSPACLESVTGTPATPSPCDMSRTWVDISAAWAGVIAKVEAIAANARSFFNIECSLIADCDKMLAVAREDKKTPSFERCVLDQGDGIEETALLLHQSGFTGAFRRSDVADLKRVAIEAI